ncbi:hypothetical protein CUBB_gp186 [Staphylococcus phage CUB-B]|nr:hypothetical protein CUBB_gp186 [Staphylococcus phage CUB-B]
MLITPILITAFLIILFSFTFPLILCGFDGWKEYLKLVSVLVVLLSLSALPNILLWLGII